MHAHHVVTVRARAVVALLSQSTLAAAARVSAVSERTLRRWMADDEDFKLELAEARQAAFQAGMSRVQALAATAVDTLATLMAQETDPRVRLGAARTVAELAIDPYDADTILRRLDEIESHQC
jgi:hypothetical protein